MLKAIAEIESLAKQNSLKFHIIKFKAVLGRLLEFETSKSYATSSQNLLAPLSELKASILLKEGSDFFWQSVHRMYSCLKKNESHELLELHYSYILIHSFDSFFKQIPEESYVSFQNNGDENVPLIKLRISLPSSSGNILRLKKIANSKLVYGIQTPELNDVYYYELPIDNLPVHHRLIYFPINSHPTIIVLSQAHQCIFEDGYIRQCSDNSYWGYQIVSKISTALTSIKSVDSNLYERICKKIKYIVPIGSNKKINPPNFSSAILKESIFLSIFSQGSQTIANIIHEFSHCELHRIQDTVLLVNEGHESNRYYSPWRIDHRPLLGLIHGIYVSNNIVDFFYKMVNTNAYQILYPDLLIKIEILIHQILNGIRQISPNALTEFSKRLIVEITDEAIKIATDLSLNLSNPPFEITDHIKKWKNENPGMLIIDSQTDTIN